MSSVSILENLIQKSIDKGDSYQEAVLSLARASTKEKSAILTEYNDFEDIQKFLTACSIINDCGDQCYTESIESVPDETMIKIMSKILCKQCYEELCAECCATCKEH